MEVAKVEGEMEMAPLWRLERSHRPQVVPLASSLLGRRRAQRSALAQANTQAHRD